MRQNVIHLENFYTTLLGQAAIAMVGRRLSALWPDIHGQTVLGHGFAYPYLRTYAPQARLMCLTMPGSQGAIAHQGHRGFISCLSEETLLPFRDAQFDKVLVSHAIEETPDLPALLSEFWRIIKPEGRLVIIASNRAGPVSYTHLRAHETEADLVCRLLLEKKKPNL